MREALGPGARVGPYALLQHRGSGGMGSVWEATAADGSRVALKLMHEHLVSDGQLIERFHREHDVGRRVTHHSLVRMRDLGSHDGVPYLVMDLVPGKSLRRLLDKGGPFREWEAAAVGAQVAEGLADLHRLGVVHRDLKSSNIILDRDLHAVLIDYGIARVSGNSKLTQDASFLGSAEYSSPEPYFGREITPRSDVYSLGIVLFEMLTGRVPFRSDRYSDTLRMHAERGVPSLRTVAPGTSDAMSDLVDRLVSKQASRRPSAEDAAAELRRLAEWHGRRVPGRQAHDSPPASPGGPRQPAATHPGVPGPVPPLAPNPGGAVPPPMPYPPAPGQWAPPRRRAPAAVFFGAGLAAAVVLGAVVAALAVSS